MLQLSLFLSPLRLQLGAPSLDSKALCVRHPVDPGQTANLHPWQTRVKAVPATHFIYSEMLHCTVSLCNSGFHLILLLESASSCRCLAPYRTSLFPSLFSSYAFPSCSAIQEVLSCLPQPSVTELTGRCGSALWGSVYGTLSLNQDWGYCPCWGYPLSASCHFHSCQQ